MLSGLLVKTMHEILSPCCFGPSLVSQKNVNIMISDLPASRKIDLYGRAGVSILWQAMHHVQEKTFYFHTLSFCFALKNILQGVENRCSYHFIVKHRKIIYTKSWHGADSPKLSSKQKCTTTKGRDIYATFPLSAVLSLVLIFDGVSITYYYEI